MRLDRKAQLRASGVVVYIVLLVGTSVLLKRQVTTELFLIVGWTTLMFLELNALFAQGQFMKSTVIVFLVMTLIFAVIPELRGYGTGSEFLQKLEDELPAQNGVFIEAESPDTAKTDEEVTLRRRRIHFYLSNGAVLTNTKCLLFGVDYNILYIGRSDIDLPAEQLHCAVQDLYREIYHPFYGRLCKPYVSKKVSVLDANDYLI